MSGIDTSRGINSVASTIAALEANGTQVVTTNTGAHVTGLEAAAYEFGAILASYPADAPPLTRNAAVFQVTDANGNTSMVSLNDLADDIRRQTGYDPLIEFSQGLGATSDGFSIADITYILNSIENRYSSMTFSQLTQVSSDAPLQVLNNHDSSIESVVSELADDLDASRVQFDFANHPNGIDINDMMQI
jgi:hypothetical protein